MLTPDSIMPFGIYQGQKMKDVSPVYLYRMFVLTRGYDKDSQFRNYFNQYYVVDEQAIHEAMRQAITLK